jgi:anti-sigma B factor antagonist
MKVEAESYGDILVLTPAGPRIDAVSAIAFKDAMRREVDNAEGRVLVNLEAVEAIDSSGLGAVVAVMKMLGGERRLELVNLAPPVDAVFRLTRMDTVMTLHKAFPPDDQARVAAG